MLGNREVFRWISTRQCLVLDEIFRTDLELDEAQRRKSTAKENHTGAKFVLKSSEKIVI